MPVVVDFDNNKRMDTEIDAARVLITDVQIKVRDEAATVRYIELVDDTGIRWNFRQLSYREVEAGGETSVHFATPPVLPIDSALHLRFETSAQSAYSTVYINMIGRLVTM